MVTFKFRPYLHGIYLFVGLCFLFIALYQPILNFDIPDEKINTVIEEKLPITRNMAVSKIHLTEFKMTSLPGNVVTADVKSVTSSLGEKMVIFLSLDTRLRVLNGDIYLDQTSLNDVILDIPGVDRDSMTYALYQAGVFAAFESMRETLHTEPFIDFSSAEGPEVIISHVLHSVRFDDGVMIVSIDPGNMISEYALSILASFLIFFVLTGIKIKPRTKEPTPNLLK